MWKIVTGLQWALNSSPSNTLKNWKIILEHQCPTSLMLLWLNEVKSRSQASKSCGKLSQKSEGYYGSRLMPFYGKGCGTGGSTITYQFNVQVAMCFWRWSGYVCLFFCVTGNFMCVCGDLTFLKNRYTTETERNMRDGFHLSKEIKSSHFYGEQWCHVVGEVLH